MQDFFTTEFTCLPKILDEHFGKFYNNTVVNGVTWTFFLWTFLHIWFEKSVNMLMRRMLIKEYIRKRLLHSIWLCGFCGTSYFYCMGTILRNNLDIATYRSSLTSMYESTVPGHLVLGLILLMGFYIHSLIYDLLQEAPIYRWANYLSMCILIGYAYTSRRIEMYLSIVAISSFTKFITEVLSIFVGFTKPNNSEKSKLLMNITLGFNIIMIVFTHIVLTTILLLYPLAFFIYKHQQSYSILILNILLIIWTITEVINSPLYKFINHWLNHDGVTNQKICLGNPIECSLFPPRDDMSFCIKLIKEGIKEREEKMRALQKPKHKGLLAQTLRCIGMMTIKKKVRARRVQKSVENIERKLLVNDNGDNASNTLREVSDSETNSESEESPTTSDENN